MGKKISAYQANDGKIFTGAGAKEKMEAHDRYLTREEKIKVTTDYARHLFKVPRCNEMDEIEEEFIAAIGGDPQICDFDDLIKQFIGLKDHDNVGFNLLIDYIRAGR